MTVRNNSRRLPQIICGFLVGILAFCVSEVIVILISRSLSLGSTSSAQNSYAEILPVIGTISTYSAWWAYEKVDRLKISIGKLVFAFLLIVIACLGLFADPLKYRWFSLMSLFVSARFIYKMIREVYADKYVHTTHFPVVSCVADQSEEYVEPLYTKPELKFTPGKNARVLICVFLILLIGLLGTAVSLRSTSIRLNNAQTELDNTSERLNSSRKDLESARQYISDLEEIIKSQANNLSFSEQYFLLHQMYECKDNAGYISETDLNGFLNE